MSVPLTSVAKAPLFSPDECAIAPIRQAVKNKQDVMLTVDGVGQVLVRASEGECLPGPINDIEKFCTTPREKIRINVLDPETARRQAGGRIGRNIDELLWTAAFYASQGRLMAGCNTYDVVQIRHWPNLSRLPQTPNTARIMALLTRYPTSISLAYRLLKISAEEIYRVYSAARCAGLAYAVNGQVQERPVKPHRHQTLLGQLLNKIAGL